MERRVPPHEEEGLPGHRRHGARQHGRRPGGRTRRDRRLRRLRQIGGADLVSAPARAGRRQTAAQAARLRIGGSHVRSTRRSRPHRRRGRRVGGRRPARGRAVRRRRRRVAQLRRRQRQHEVLPAGPDRHRQLRRPAHRLALAVRRQQRRPGIVAPAQRRPADLHPRPAGDAADDRRRALPDHRALPGGGGRRRHRRDPLGARSASLRGRRPDARVPLARPRLVERRRRRPHLLGHERGVPDRGRRPHRRAGPRLSATTAAST